MSVEILKPYFEESFRSTASEFTKQEIIFEAVFNVFKPVSLTKTKICNHFNQTSESLSLEYYILWSVHEKSRATGRSYFKSVGNIFYDFAV